MVALLHLRGAGLPRVAADQHVFAFRHHRGHGLCRDHAAFLGIATDEGGLLGAEDQIVVGGDRDVRGRRHVGDLRRDVEVHRLDHDRIRPLRDDVLGLRDLRLRTVLRRLDEHLVACGFGRFLEEGHVRIQVSERRLLLQHEGNPHRLARGAGSFGGGRRRQRQGDDERRGSRKGRHQV